MIRVSIATIILALTTYSTLGISGTLQPAWQSPVDPSLEIVSRTEANRSPIYVMQGGTGFGIFQDIQVPFTPSGDRRADGSSASSELQDHLGFLLYGTVGMSWDLDITRIDLALRALLVRATLGPVETQTSSYSRFELTTGFNLLDLSDYRSTTVDLLTSVRRGNYLNISTGHYLETAALGLRLAVKPLSNWTVTSYGSYAPFARFGYSKGAFFGGDYLKGSRTEMFEVGLENAANLRSDMQVLLGASYEQGRINLGDLTGYEAFGLQVGATPGQVQKKFVLNTTLLRLGFKKSF